MSSEHEGVMIASEGGVYFVPMEDLTAYRLPDDLADAARANLVPAAEALGFSVGAPSGVPGQQRPSAAVVAPMSWNPLEPMPLGWMMLHTATRW